MPGRGIGKLVDAKLLRKAIVSHIGLNPETQRQMLAGELEVELVPQGTLIERIRAGGFGLGGVLTQTGIGTSVEEGKQRIEVAGQQYLLEIALRADFALVQAFLADYIGQSELRADGAQFQSGHRDGRRHCDRQRRPHRSGRRDRAGPCRDAGARGRLSRRQFVRPRMEPQAIIARRIARELAPGMLVNLGIGIPTLVANYLPPECTSSSSRRTD